MPAILVWIALELDATLRERAPSRSPVRPLSCALACLALLLGSMSDVEGRWTHNLTVERLSLSSPYLAKWLPDPGGILYSADMGVFYGTFYENPRAPWRYMLGFEVGLMPDPDIAIFREIQRQRGAIASYMPWVEELRPEDRLVIVRPPGPPPEIPQLEWTYAAKNLWIGRVPRGGPRTSAGPG
jgi:hypothetical protein